MAVHFDTDEEDVKLKLIREKEEEDVVSILAPKYGAEYTDLSVAPIETDALKLVEEARAREGGLAVFDKSGRTLSIAFVNAQNPIVQEVISDLVAKGYTVKKYLVSHKSLAKAHARYAEISTSYMSKVGVFGLETGELDKVVAEYSSLKVLKIRLDELLSQKKGNTVSHVFEEIFAAAYALHASDIHMEPEEKEVRLRIRVDGLLEDVYQLDKHTYQMLSSRLKLLSGIKLNITNKAQDGRFTIDVGSTQIEIRTSLIPGSYGESFVLRILDPNTIHRSFEEMGVEGKLLERLRKEIRRPNGMLLVTGPTGSGKTTTLYTFMQDVYQPDIKIVTIEDPIEYHLGGIVQTQTDGKDYTFASGLRSVLRQDPDVIMVGEIRDKEVAETALQAALTGHFVFSTLHTNNAAGSFPRLIDLGADPKLFASAITVSMAQRLVRTLDDATKKPRPALPEEKAMMQKVFEGVTDPTLLPASFDTLYDATPTESGTGYKGRIGVHEAIFMDDELGEFLRNNPSEGDIKKHVMRQGFLNMEQDGVRKALLGKTTIEELRRVIDLPL
jgi:type IV pilus assembly protein PilB